MSTLQGNIVTNTGGLPQILDQNERAGGAKETEIFILTGKVIHSRLEMTGSQWVRLILGREISQTLGAGQSWDLHKVFLSLLHPALRPGF